MYGAEFGLDLPYLSKFFEDIFSRCECTEKPWYHDLQYAHGPQLKALILTHMTQRTDSAHSEQAHINESEHIRQTLERYALFRPTLMSQWRLNLQQMNPPLTPNVRVPQHESAQEYNAEHRRWFEDYIMKAQAYSWADRFHHAQQTLTKNSVSLPKRAHFLFPNSLSESALTLIKQLGTQMHLDVALYSPSASLWFLGHGYTEESESTGVRLAHQLSPKLKTLHRRVLDLWDVKDASSYQPLAPSGGLRKLQSDLCASQESILHQSESPNLVLTKQDSSFLLSRHHDFESSFLAALNALLDFLHDNPEVRRSECLICFRNVDAKLEDIQRILSDTFPSFPIEQIFLLPHRPTLLGSDVFHALTQTFELDGLREFLCLTQNEVFKENPGQAESVRLLRESLLTLPYSPRGADPSDANAGAGHGRNKAKSFYSLDESEWCAWNEAWLHQALGSPNYEESYFELRNARWVTQVLHSLHIFRKLRQRLETPMSLSDFYEWSNQALQSTTLVQNTDIEGHSTQITPKSRASGTTISEEILHRELFITDKESQPFSELRLTPLGWIDVLSNDASISETLNTSHDKIKIASLAACAHVPARWRAIVDLHPHDFPKKVQADFSTPWYQGRHPGDALAFEFEEDLLLASMHHSENCLWLGCIDGREVDEKNSEVCMQKAMEALPEILHPLIEYAEVENLRTRTRESARRAHTDVGAKHQNEKTPNTESVHQRATNSDGTTPHVIEPEKPSPEEGPEGSLGESAPHILWGDVRKNASINFEALSSFSFSPGASQHRLLQCRPHYLDRESTPEQLETRAIERDGLQAYFQTKSNPSGWMHHFSLLNNNLITSPPIEFARKTPVLSQLFQRIDRNLEGRNIHLTLPVISQRSRIHLVLRESLKIEIRNIRISSSAMRHVTRHSRRGPLYFWLLHLSACALNSAGTTTWIEWKQPVNKDGTQTPWILSHFEALPSKQAVEYLSAFVHTTFELPNHLRAFDWRRLNLEAPLFPKQRSKKGGSAVERRLAKLTAYSNLERAIEREVLHEDTFSFLQHWKSEVSDKAQETMRASKHTNLEELAAALSSEASNIKVQP